MQSHTDYICVAFLHCVFSNVSSSCLPERTEHFSPRSMQKFEKMWSKIAPLKIFATQTMSATNIMYGLHILFSMRNDLLSHWLHFFSLLHCGFSNVSLKHLHERMHSHNGCICFLFLHCVFLNESSN